MEVAEVKCKHIIVIKARSIIFSHVRPVCQWLEDTFLPNLDNESFYTRISTWICKMNFKKD